MDTTSLSPQALTVIDQYLHFKMGSAVCSVPYFNNKTVRARGTLPVYVGKGSPEEILDEVHALVVKSHASLDSLTDELLKKLLVDNNIGIDCSGLTYHVLNAESQGQGKGLLKKRLSFPAVGLLKKIASTFNPAKNASVSVFADNANSSVIQLNDIKPGDFISMLGGPDTNDRDHILVIHTIEHRNSVPWKVHYSHAVAYPEDGVYGTGIRQGTIEITDPAQSLTEARWVENNLSGESNRIFTRALKSTTEIRRLK